MQSRAHRRTVAHSDAQAPTVVESGGLGSTVGNWRRQRPIDVATVRPRAVKRPAHELAREVQFGRRKTGRDAVKAAGALRCERDAALRKR